MQEKNIDAIYSVLLLVFFNLKLNFTLLTYMIFGVNQFIIKIIEVKL